MRPCFNMRMHLVGSVTAEYDGSWNNELNEPEIDMSLPPKQQGRVPSALSHHTTAHIKSDTTSRKVFHQHLAKHFLNARLNQSNTR